MKTKFTALVQRHITQPELFFGLLFAIGAALGFSAKAIFVKLAYQYHVDAITLLMFRMLFALPFFIFFALVEERKAKKSIPPRQFALIFGLGLLGYYLSSLFDFLGLQYISAGLERLILFVYPTFVVILSALFFGQKIRKEVLFALLLSYVGIGFAMLHDLEFSEENLLLGAGLVLASTLTYSLFLVGSDQLIPQVGAKRFTAYAMMVSCVAVLLNFAVLRDVSTLHQPLAVYGYGLAMALFSTVLPAFLLAAAIQRIGASETAMIGSLGPVATIGLAAIFLAEPMSWVQMVGAVFVMAGVAVLGRGKR